jgi:hypothetical protein
MQQGAKKEADERRGREIDSQSSEREGLAEPLGD